MLEPAYDDALGVTAAFNRNVLLHLNRRFGFDFRLDGFGHRGFYNEEAGRIEMHLEALADQAVSLDGQARRFRKGERIHTENSYKYRAAEFEELLHVMQADEAGLAQELFAEPRRLRLYREQPYASHQPDPCGEGAWTRLPSGPVGRRNYNDIMTHYDHRTGQVRDITVWPELYGWGAGAESRRMLGLAVVDHEVEIIRHAEVDKESRIKQTPLPLQRRRHRRGGRHRRPGSRTGEAADGRQGRVVEDAAQRAVPVRLGQEVQALPRQAELKWR